MKLYLHILSFLIFPCLLYSQNEQVISLANGFSLKCKITSLDSNRVVFIYMQNGVYITDSLKMSEVYKIAYPNRREDATVVFKHNWFLDDKGRLVFAEEDKRTLNLQMNLMSQYKESSGRTFVIMGSSFLGASLLLATTGAILVVQPYGPSPGAGIGLMALGGTCFVNGLTFTTLGLSRLKQAKAYNKVINSQPPEISLGPAIIKPANFAMSNSYGAGLRLRF
ncbi:MAG: hypothetical protein U0V74_17275 [Chitinophagales bacterium]